MKTNKEQFGMKNYVGISETLIRMGTFNTENEIMTTSSCNMIPRF